MTPEGTSESSKPIARSVLATFVTATTDRLTVCPSAVTKSMLLPTTNGKCLVKMNCRGLISVPPLSPGALGK